MKRMLIVGYGVTGKAFYQALKQKQAEIFVYDDKAEVVEPGVRLYDPSLHYDLALITPGIPPQHRLLQKLRAAGTVCMGEMDFAFQDLKGKILGITGTNGKTTTTHLLYEMMRREFPRSFLAGNVGIPLLGYVKDSTEEDYYITELSSFQLADIRNFHPWMGAITNLRSDHLNWHGSMEHYEKSKFRLFSAISSQRKIYNGDDGFLLERLAAHGISREGLYAFRRKGEVERGSFLRGDDLIFRDGREEKIASRSSILMQGDHNLENALLAMTMARIAGVSKDAIQETLAQFRGLPHRYEVLGEKEGIRYINDSKATNPDSSLPALLSAQRPTILLAGGMDKGSSFEELFEAMTDKVEALVVYGETSEALEQEALAHQKKVFRVRDLEEAFHKARSLSKAGYDILLSPACASWDMYDNFEQRGDHFRKLFGELT